MKKTILALSLLVASFSFAQESSQSAQQADQGLPQYGFSCTFARWDQSALNSGLAAYVGAKEPTAQVQVLGAVVDLTRINNHQMVVQIYVNGKLAATPTIVEGASKQFAMSASVVGMNCFQSLE